MKNSLPKGSFSKDKNGELILTGDPVFIRKLNTIGFGKITSISPNGRCARVKISNIIYKGIYPKHIELNG